MYCLVTVKAFEYIIMAHGGFTCYPCNPFVRNSSSVPREDIEIILPFGTDVLFLHFAIFATF